MGNSIHKGLIISHAMSRTKRMSIYLNHTHKKMVKKKSPNDPTRYSRLPVKFAMETSTSRNDIILYHDKIIKVTEP